ncbi:MAG: ribonuclease PH [Bdellovibrionaceae bacterium]|nr:ribonuclease PH [Pseudobdellovibrionaceae bacterium]
MRQNDRPLDQMRPLEFEVGVNKFAEGSCLVKFGDTHVLCTATLEEGVPKWLAGKNEGWITAEYCMLPRSTHQRIRRDKALTGGRTQEISRLIGRSLRAGFDLSKIPEKSFVVDCDVLQADGGTRTAAITGGYVALRQAFNFLLKQGLLQQDPTQTQIAAVSIGRLNGQCYVDLDYEEDSHCESDVNFVMNSKKEFIEIQGTAENNSFSQDDLIAMMGLALKTGEHIFERQTKYL